MNATIRRKSSGFTLIELLVVIAIVAVLAALAVVGAFKAMKTARSASNLAKLKDLGAILQSYAGEYGHFPPGDDAFYTENGFGPDMMTWQSSRNRYPDILNAYMEKPDVNEFFLSPTLQSNVDKWVGSYQPTNYIGHPALLYDGQDRDAFEGLGTPPFSSNIVQRPSETLLLVDGEPTDNSDAKGCPTTLRSWAQDGSVLVDNGDLGEANLTLEIGGKGKYDYRWIDFRNNDKAHVLFADGSVRPFTPQEFKVKHVALGY